MLSKKLTFSLTSLVVLLAMGLIYAVPSAMADGGNDGRFTVTLTPAETMIDVSSDDGMQIASGRDRASRDLINISERQATLITLLITTNEVVNLGDPDADVTGGDLTGRSGQAIATAVDEYAAQVLDISDIVIDAYDAEGRSLGILDLDALGEETNVIVLTHRDPNNPGREFLARIDETRLTDAYSSVRGGGQTLEIHTLLFSIPRGVMQQADIAHVTAFRNRARDHIHVNEHADVLRIDLVDDDEGLARYNTGVGTAATTAGVPGVVAIQSLRERRGFIETDPFQVRVILTEEPAGGLTSDKIMVRNGSATAVVKGATLKGGVTYTEPDTPGELTTSIVSYTKMDGEAAAAADLPQATGRDNKYHQYFVTIAPNPGLTGADVVISVKQFSDKVIPTPRMYVPLSYHQIVATTLTSGQQTVRNARVANETLTVTATTTAAVDVFKPSADAKLPHEKFIPAGFVIPANGYLVLASGDYGQSGILKAETEIAKKKRIGETLYNTVEKFDPPYPGNDLANAFRNGTTIQLSYQDIPGNTAEANTKTGYAGATSATINKGDVIISEIMWGYDRGLDDRAYTEGQWIELHNTTSAAISLDKQEWILSYGTTNSFAAGIVVDTVSNNPASGYWEVPGQSGVSKSDPRVKEDDKQFDLLDREVSDIISMSRVAGAADGTAKASWAMSIPPSTNFAAGSASRVGTPGAANSYDTSAMKAADQAAKDAQAAKDKAAADAAAASKAPAASPGDLMITEIMVASNGGKLPQWIEIANVSAAAVSLTGWSISINNDPADTDVIAPSVNLKLGDVVIGADQVALVVSKTGRNSGVDTAGNARAKGDANAGNFDADRIIDVQADVSTVAQYSLISEMAFRISLIPPLPGGSGVVDRPDVVGNLGQGWELPMSEGNPRSSLIRREMDGTTEILGTDEAGWVLASETSYLGGYVETYYGDKDDEGTPGYNAGGALPVELSKFNAKRDPLSGQVIITWETQSELNNAGFFIKRSQQKDSKFVAVNPTMIPGAGTVSEKQSYTYTDTTAKPNIVYYYQIEDVSLDGNRQTLTRAHRLKGHIGAAGKATTTWGELKTSLEQ